MVIPTFPIDNENHVIYDINFYSDTIRTLVTDSPAMVDQWIYETNPEYRNIFVGLDIEWRPAFNRNIYNPVATLQLCVSHRCLVYQIIHSPYIPDSLEQFLGDDNHLCVGVGIDSDVEKLTRDYGLTVANTADLRTEAAERMGVWELRNAGLRQLTAEVLQKDVYKPRWITLSRWDNQVLTAEQVRYACLDAFLSWEIGWNLIAGWECTMKPIHLLLTAAAGILIILLLIIQVTDARKFAVDQDMNNHHSNMFGNQYQLIPNTTHAMTTKLKLDGNTGVSGSSSPHDGHGR